MKKEPLVSVIMAVYNNERYVAEAIESIINQTYKNWELLIAYDVSTDNTLEIINRYTDRDSRIRILVSEIKTNQSEARNTALKVSNGEYIAILDADDIALPNRLEVQIDYLQAHKEVSVVGCPVLIIDYTGYDNGKIIGKSMSYEEIKFMMLFKNCIAHSSITIRRMDIVAIGGYRNTQNEDYDMQSRLSRHGCLFISLAEPLVKYRVHDKSLGHILPKEEIYDATLRVSKENLNRYLAVGIEDAREMSKLITGRKLSFKHTLSILKLYKNLAKAYETGYATKFYYLLFIKSIIRSALPFQL